jgi:hypothetical protein
MSAERGVVLYCDAYNGSCGDVYVSDREWPAIGAARIDAAHHADWTHSDDHGDLCPIHSPEVDG